MVVMAEGPAPYQNEDEGSSEHRFSPPLYQQRYDAVLEVARIQQPKKVVDFGCAECKLLRLLKRELYIESLVGVDLDPVPLSMHVAMVHPLITDHLHPRSRPFYMALMQGSIAQPDARLMDYDLLTCVEVIEHLEGPVLDAVPNAIFGFLHPKRVIMTTPNAEYNVLFPGFTGFRHYDHKFEWTREQFQHWCDEVCSKFGYVVEYGGVGRPPPDRAEVGYCSQMGIFTRTSSTDTRTKCNVQPATYKVICEATHPHRVDSRSKDQKLREECEYYLHILMRNQVEAEGCQSDMCAVPLSKLLVFSKVKALCGDTASQDIRRVLASSDVKLDSTGENALIPCEASSSEEEGELTYPASPPNTDVSRDTLAADTLAADTFAAECWDLPP